MKHLALCLLAVALSAGCALQPADGDGSEDVSGVSPSPSGASNAEAPTAGALRASRPPLSIQSNPDPVPWKGGNGGNAALPPRPGGAQSPGTDPSPTATRDER
jgi:hypothetical protein